MSTRSALVRLACIAFVAALCFVVALPAQTPPPPAKRLPPAGIAIPDTARAELTAATAELRRDLDTLARDLASPAKAPLPALLPDAEIFHKAVDWALRYDEFFDLKHIDVARRLLRTGHERAAQLRAGSAPWTEATGSVIRAYRSKLDGSIQPYALTIPASWKKSDPQARRLDVVILGRGEKRTELGFILERERPARENDITPAEGIVLTPYGRFCNATKFAGEVDVFEALAAVRAAYRIDDDRVVLRGFSMGGASTWHLATHYPDVWAVASPGAGFAETPVYAKVFAPGKPERAPWEQTLWRWYDATGYAANLRHLPVVAYSGEIDPQKQAADIMEKALEAEGLKLEHLIGPQTAHKYHPETKQVLTARLDELVARGRTRLPAEGQFTTYTPRYSSSGRINILELEQSWERSDVRYKFVSPQEVEVHTRNIAVFRVALDHVANTTLVVDGQRVALAASLDPATYWLAKEKGRWVAQDQAFAAHHARAAAPRKSPGLSGPIMDAFMEPFLFVRPTGQPLNPALAKWTAAELAHATKMWRDIFRGEVVIKDDTAVTAEDLAKKNLVLWGDASSNQLLARMLATRKLPITWDAKQLTLRGQSYDAAHHAPVLVFPNPLTPAGTKPRYVVVNSGVDFRDEAYGTNSLQTPKLPDYAIIDLRTPPGPRWPGKIVVAGFFNEAWR